jgi:hypothetical protein
MDRIWIPFKIIPTMKSINYKKISGIVFGLLAVTFTFSSCRKEPVLAPATEQVCFDQKVMPVLQSHCAVSGCHDAGGESPQFTSYDDVKSLVKAGDPNKSKLYNVITSKGFVLTAMPPKGSTQLSIQNINDITVWILQDATHTTCP